MSAVAIGRAQAIAAPTEWGGRSWDAQGDTVKFEGAIYSTSLTAARSIRQQLLGHAEAKDVVPVTSADDPTIDGYYRVLSSSVSYSAQGPNLFPVSVDLERVLAYADPLFESVLIGADLTNGLGQAGNAWHGIPDAVKGYSQTSLTAENTRVGEDGTTRINFFSAYGVTPRYLLAPASFYIGAATFKVEDTGTTLRTVAGMQCENKPNDWEVSNGFCRARPGSTAGTLDVAIWDGSQWETKTWVISHATGTLDAFNAVTVLRNSPEEVIIRLLCATSVGNAEGRITVDVALRRGEAMIRAYIQSEVSRAWKVARSSAEAATSITGGIRATSNDAAGNRYVVLSATATTKDTVNGALSIAAGATAVGFGIGSSLAGSGAVAPNVITGTRGLVEQYFAAQTEAMATAGR